MSGDEKGDGGAVAAARRKLVTRLRSAAAKLEGLSDFAIAEEFERIHPALLAAVEEVERIAGQLSRLSMESTYPHPDDFWLDVAWKPDSGRRALKKAARRAAADAYEKGRIAYREVEQAYHASIEAGEASQATRQVYRAAEMVYRAAEDAAAVKDAYLEVNKPNRTLEMDEEVERAERAVERAYAALENDRKAYRAAEEIYRAEAKIGDTDGAAEQAYRAAEQVSDAAVEAKSAFLYLTDDRAQAFIDKRKNL